jgi:hypothetical protein
MGPAGGRTLQGPRALLGSGRDRVPRPRDACRGRDHVPPSCVACHTHTHTHACPCVANTGRGGGAVRRPAHAYSRPSYGCEARGGAGSRFANCCFPVLCLGPCLKASTIPCDASEDHLALLRRAPCAGRSAPGRVPRCPRCHKAKHATSASSLPQAACRGAEATSRRQTSRAAPPPPSPQVAAGLEECPDVCSCQLLQSHSPPFSRASSAVEP